MKNEPLRLSVTAARERDNPRGRVESIRAGMKTLADRIHAEQRHKPGWTPAPDYRVVAKADTYKGRDYEALLKAALKPPVGYWEDAPRGVKFGGGGGGTKTGTQDHVQPSPAPSSDPYEPVGTPIVEGDSFVNEHVLAPSRWSTPTLCSKIKDGTIYDVDGNAMICTFGFEAPYAHIGWRILKRKPAAAVAPKLTVRAWMRLQSGKIWLSVDGKQYLEPVGTQGWTREPGCDDLEMSPTNFMGTITTNGASKAG